MRFSADWQDTGISASAELRATFCLLEIAVDGKQVSRFLDNRSDRAHGRIAMPAYPPAQGLARAWWSLIGGRSGTVHLRRFRDGFALPDLRLSPDGRYVDVSAEPCEYDNPPVVFTRHARERMELGIFERDLAEFIESVLLRLTDKGVADSWLERRWSDIRESLADNDERLFCEAAGALRIDPYLATDAETAAIERAAAYFGADGLPEFLSGQTLEEVGRATAWVDQAEQALGSRAALPDLGEVGRLVRRQIPDSAWTTRPWELGYRAATACREHLALPMDAVFPDIGDVARLFGGVHFEAAPGHVPGLRAEANGEHPHPRIVVADLTAPTSRTFAMMRAVGDFIVHGENGRAPITDTYSFRQGVGRAFAAEMIAPRAVVLDMRDQGMSTEEIAAARHISEVAVIRHLENADLRPAV